VSNFVLILFLIFIQFLHRAQRDEAHEKEFYSLRSQKKLNKNYFQN